MSHSRPAALLPRAVLAVLTVLIVLTARSLWRSAHDLEVTHYELSAEQLTDSIRIVQLTDLHNSEFGEENAQLVDAVRQQQPDVIFMTGDMLLDSEQDLSIAAGVVRQLTAVAPVYVSYGNHEKQYEERWQSDLCAVFAEAGAAVLDDSYIDTEINGQAVRIGGGYGYGQPEATTAHSKNAAFRAESAYLKQVQATDRYKLLLWHMPVCWIQNGSLDAWDIDVVFSGHAHGGQIIFPGIGGLYAPDQGFFPGREWGLFHSDDGEHTLVLSRGLGNSMNIPRWNNTPEIVTVDIVPAE